MKSVNAVVAGLSPVEREQFSTLIEECQQREEQIKSSVEKGLYFSEKLAEANTKLIKRLNSALESTEKIKSSFDDLSLFIKYQAFDLECIKQEQYISEQTEEDDFDLDSN